MVYGSIRLSSGVDTSSMCMNAGATRSICSNVAP